MCLFSPHPPHLVFLYGDWQRRTRAVAPWGAPADLSPASIFPLVTPLVLAEVEVLEAWAAVGSVSGPSWQIQGTRSPWFSLSFRWRRSRIIWKWRVLNRQPSGELSCEEWEWLVLVWDDYSVGTLRIYVWQEVCHMVFTRCCRMGFVIFVWWDYMSVDAGLVSMSVFDSCISWRRMKYTKFSQEKYSKAIVKLLINHDLYSVRKTGLQNWM